MFASENRVKIPSKSITTFWKNLSFSSIFHCILDSVFAAKYNKRGRMSSKRYSISFQIKKQKKENFRQNSSGTAMFSTTYEQPKSKQWFYWNFALHSQHYAIIEITLVKIVLITAVAAATCCLFWWVEYSMVEAEMYDTNNRRSLDLSEFKKERSLNFWKFA